MNNYLIIPKNFQVIKYNFVDKSETIGARTIFVYDDGILNERFS